MPLPSAEEYRQRASSVRVRAQKFEVGPEQTALLKLAAQWDRLAQYKDEQDLD
jgi:hypothetical protein